MHRVAVQRSARHTPSRSAVEQVVAAVLFAATTAAVSWIGSRATSAGQDWYDELDRPWFTPPDATFGVVWTALYVAIAAAGWLAWRSVDDPRPTIAWATQLALNLGWSSVFFGLESVVGGLVVIVALIAAAAVTALLAWQANRLAGLMFVPYLLWLLFAAALNVGIGVLNGWT